MPVLETLQVALDSAEAAGRVLCLVVDTASAE